MSLMKWNSAISVNRLFLTQSQRHFHPRSLGSCIFASSWSSSNVRSTYIDFFKSNEHVYITPSSVIPRKGEGTYFTNAGMNQFKPIFLNEVEPSSKLSGLTRVVNSQKCIRVGGKHNDLEDVGHDLTHHTFFEMLGNWSFGDYFKPEACRLAYHLLTKQYQVPIDRLYFTYFAGDQNLGLKPDEETRDVWASLGISKDRILPFGTKDNFWEMGQTGPCGPCTEIHYDHVGGRHAGSEVNSGSPNVVEIWNLVFMQYNRQNDQSLQALPSQHVDTGMGLERMTAVLNNTPDNYSTDLFLPLFDVIQKVSGCPKYSGQFCELDTAYRTLADHCRMITVAITDGLLPSNENLGHKLRSIIHRCIELSSESFGSDPQILLPQLVQQVVRSLGEAFPELVASEAKVTDVVKASIDHYDKTKELFGKSFQKLLNKLGTEKLISVEDIIALEKGHFGTAMPFETILAMAQQQGLKVDVQGYKAVVEQGKEDIAKPGRFEMTPDPSDPLVNQLISKGVKVTADEHKYSYKVTDDGYDFHTMAQDMAPCQVLGMSSHGQTTELLTKDCEGEIILDKTCFYAESGGQQADRGILVSKTGKFHVRDVQHRKGYVVHYGVVEKGTIRAGQDIYIDIAQGRRESCMRNHTATHLLHAALVSNFPHTQQQGSNVTHYKMTFDFLASSAPTTEEIEEVESTVREMIQGKYTVSRRVMPLADALSLDGVKTLQNEEYPEEVSVIDVHLPDSEITVSRELCGGTHVHNTEHLQDFCITHVGAKSQSVRRATCVTGEEAELAHVNGDIVKIVCEVLELMVEEKNLSDVPLVELGSNLQQGLEYHNALQEMLEDLLQVDANDVTGCRQKWQQVLDDLNVAQELTHSIYVDLDKVENDATKAAAFLKHIVNALNKFDQLELVPKTARDQIRSTLEKLGHKVSTLYNTMAIDALKQLIDFQAEDVSSQGFVCVPYNLDLNVRQVVKAVAQKSCDRLLVCMRATERETTVVLSLPLALYQPLSKEDFDWLLTQISGSHGECKGKLANQNEAVAVYTVSAKTRLQEGEVVRLILEMMEGK